MKRLHAFLFLCGLFLFTTNFLHAQSSISGTVTDTDGEALVGVNVVLSGTINGTITNVDGNFELKTSKSFPLTLEFSFIGYAPQKVEVTSADQEIKVALAIAAETLGSVTVSAASRVDEDIMDAPVTIEAITLDEIRSSASLDAYSNLGNLKGVQGNTGSITFTSYNTRGFADMQNWRFVQLIDGMEANAPGLGYPVGGNSGPADIDIASIELVPGANSALYGANAFNGILTINTKDPFYYQGLSAYVKSGVTVQEAGGTNPLNDIGFRYAKAFNNKFAFKVNVGYTAATDWTANDDSYYISNGIATTATQEQINGLLQTPRTDPNYNAVNVYGDEVTALVDLDGDPNTDPVAINRTGIKEEDIIDYDVNVFKADAALHYRITDNIEANYSYRYIQSDAILRHTTIYPLVNLTQQFHRFEVKGSDWNVKAFYSLENANESYAMLNTGGFIEQGRRSNADWATDYGQAFRGEISGITAGDHGAARTYADGFVPGPDSNVFQSLRTQTLTNSDLTTGGSKFVDNTSLASIDANYNITPIADILEVQLGARYRRFLLESEGQLFNDGDLGFGEPIPVEEYGAYVQIGKKLVNDRLRLRASMRYDKHQDFDGRFTPRASAVFALSPDGNHNLRTSIQTGFRNATAQEGYINLDIGPAILLGGIENNLKNFSQVNPNSGAIVEGQQIYDNLITIASLPGVLTGTGAPELANLQPLIQERNTTWEIGYKGLFADKVFVDLNYYQTTYQDLITRITTFSLDVLRAYAVYTNVSDDIRSDGFGASIDYLIGNGFKAGFNYTYTSFDANTAVENNPSFLPSFNTPENRFNISLSGSNVKDTNLGFNIKYRWWEGYTWQSPFGAGAIDGAGVVDLALNYELKNLKSMIKLGASNLLNNEYRTVYGGPMVGSIYYISWTFDQNLGR